MARRNLDGQYVILSLFGLLYVFITFYHLFFEFLWNGQTPGKRVFGLRVVQTNGLPVGTSGTIIRNLLRLFAFLPAFYGMALIFIFPTPPPPRLASPPPPPHF